MELTEHSYAELILTNSIRVGSQQDYFKKRLKYIKTINEMSYNKKNQRNLILEWIDLEATSRTISDAHGDAATRPGLDIDRGERVSSWTKVEQIRRFVQNKMVDVEPSSFDKNTATSWSAAAVHST
jgi:hypothetical protein